VISRALFIVGAVAGGLTAAGLGWFGRGLVVDNIEIPRVIEQQGEICELVTERNSAEAVAAEQLRQFKIGEAAWQRFDRESQAAKDDAQAKLDLMELELERYAQRAQESGRVCALDDADLELLGVRQAAEPVGNSGG